MLKLPLLLAVRSYLTPGYDLRLRLFKDAV